MPLREVPVSPETLRELDAMGGHERDLLAHDIEASGQREPGEEQYRWTIRALRKLGLMVRDYRLAKTGQSRGNNDG